PAAVGNEAVDSALHAQPVQKEDLLRLRNDMHDHQMAWPCTGRELEEHGQREPDLLAIRDNRLIALADLPAGVSENQVETTELIEHRAHSARDRSCRRVVEKVGIEASRELQVVGPGALAARDLL